MYLIEDTTLIQTFQIERFHCIIRHYCNTTTCTCTFIHGVHVNVSVHVLTNSLFMHVLCCSIHVQYMYSTCMWIALYSTCIVYTHSFIKITLLTINKLTLFTLLAIVLDILVAADEKLSSVDLCSN